MISPPPSPTSQPDQAPVPVVETPIQKRGVRALFADKRVLWGLALLIMAAALLFWYLRRATGPGAGFVSGNGRLEATEIDVASKLGGRVVSILVVEGDFVLKGQALAQMQVDVLQALRDEALAQSRLALTTVESASAQVRARKSDKLAAEAMVGLRVSEQDATKRRFNRTEILTEQGAATAQDLDDNRAALRGAEAAVAGAQAQVEAAQAAIMAAEAQVVGAGSSVAASEASVARVDADIKDSLLLSPSAGRVQYRIVQPGEVVAAGGKILSLVDLGDVYMTFFLPETVVGRVAMGSEVHVVLDAAQDYVIPANVSYVASIAQFTPKTVETSSERQKLMFRVKAQLGRELLEKHRAMVKTGLPGVVWLRLDAKQKWPANLEIRLPK